MNDFNEATADLNKPYSGPSIMAMSFTQDAKNLPNPLVFHQANTEMMTLDGDHINAIKTEKMRLKDFVNADRLGAYTQKMPDFSTLNNRRIAGDAVQDDEVACVTMAFAGSWRLVTANGVLETAGSGHHGTDYVGCASVRAGKAARMVHPTPTLTQSYGAR